MFISHLPSALFKVFSHLLLVVTFDNLSSRHPNLKLTGESLGGLHGNHPSQRPHRKSAKHKQWNSTATPLCTSSDRRAPNFGTRLVKPPIEEVLLLQPAFRNLMIDDGRRFVAQPLARSQQPLAELAVLAADLATGAGAKIGSKAAVFLKQLPSKGHVGAKRSLGELTSLVAEVEKSKGAQCVFKR